MSVLQVSSGKVLAVVFLALVCSASCRGFVEESAATYHNLESVILEPLDGLRRYAESIVGAHAIEIGVEFVEMLLKFVAEGAASGLNVIAAYTSEILRATGLNETISIPHFTPEGVSTVTKWALLALIGYWLVSVVLRLALALVRRVFWLIKALVVLWLFVRIVSDPVATAEATTLRISLLVVTCAVFGVAWSGGGARGDGLESRINSLEGRVKVMERKKRD